MEKTNRWKLELEYLSSILNRFPLEKKIKWGAEVYTWEGRNVVSYAGFKNFFTLWFFNGVFLKDKYKVLINAQEGKTKSLRQWRFTSIEEIDEKKIEAYIKEAIQIEKRGLRLDKQSSPSVAPPDELSEALSKNKKLKAAFDNLRPSCQKEYINYIGEAKQATTRLRRIEKIIPMILGGTGINDHYKKVK